MALEQRTLIRPVEIRATEKGRTAGGYAALFGLEANIGGQFREIIAPGSFAEAVKGAVLALYDHEMGRVIGRSSAGTLRTSATAHGPAGAIAPPRPPDGPELAAFTDRRATSGHALGFSASQRN